MKSLMLSLLIAVVLSPSFAAQEQAAPEKPTEAEAQAALVKEAEAQALTVVATDLLTKALDRELKLLQSLTNVSDDGIASLKLALKPVVAQQAGRAWQDVNQLNNVARTQQLSPKFLRAIVDAAKDVVKDKATHQKYREDVDVRVRFRKQLSVNEFIQMLDELVGLSSKQMQAVRKLAEELEAQEKLGGQMVLAIRSGRAVDLKEEDIKGVLTDKQLKYFRTFTRKSYLTPAMMDGSKPLIPDTPERREQLIEELRLVSEMKISHIESEFALSPPQKRKLELAAKRIVSAATGKKLEAEGVYRRYIEQTQSANVGDQLDMEMLSIATTGTLQLFNANSAQWQKLVRSSLNDEQKQRWDKIQQERERGVKEAWGYILVMSFGRQLMMTGKQQIETHKLISAALTEPASGFAGSQAMMNSYKGMLNIKDEDYARAMGQGNWDKFKPQLAQLRQQVDMMKDRGKGGG